MIKVKPEEIMVQVNYLQEELKEYQSKCSVMMNTIMNLKEIWHGPDNEAFSNRILDYQKDIQHLAMILSDNINFLKQSADSYRQVQDELVAQAHNL